MARQIEAYKLRTELAVDATKGSAAMKSFQKDVAGVGQEFKKLGPEIDKTAKEAGSKFGKRFSGSATAVIESSFSSLGKTLGSVIGTAVLPGIGTAIGGAVGDMADQFTAKVGSTIGPMLQKGMALNDLIEATRIEFTTFTGSVKEADKYLDSLKKTALETGVEVGFLVDTSERLYDLTGNLELTNKILKASVDQAADFGGTAEMIQKVADALGLVAEKGVLAERDVKGLFKMGIDAPKYLAEATGWSEKYIKSLIKQGRIQGDIAAQAIAEGIERKKAGFAATIAARTTGGARRVAGVAEDLLALRGTENLNRALGDFYRTETKVLTSDKAGQLVDFLNSVSGRMIALVEDTVHVGTDAAKGIGAGLTGPAALNYVVDSVDSFAKSMIGALNERFKSNSPSQVMADEVGMPIGAGIATGIVPGFLSVAQQTKEQLVAELEKLLKDPRIQAMMDTIGKGEGTFNPQTGERIYDKIFGGKRLGSALGTAHPNVRVPFFNKKTGRTDYSTASLFGQFIKPTWEGASSALGGLDASNPHHQELAMVYLMRQRGMIGPLLRNDPRGAIRAGKEEWASLPGSSAKQPQQKMGEALSLFNQRMAAYSGVGLPVTIVDRTGNEIKFYENWNKMITQTAQIQAGQTPTGIAGPNPIAPAATNQRQQNEIRFYEQWIKTQTNTALILGMARNKENRQQAGASVRDLVSSSAGIFGPRNMFEKKFQEDQAKLAKANAEETKKQNKATLELINTQTLHLGQTERFTIAETGATAAEAAHADTATQVTEAYEKSMRKMRIEIDKIDAMAGAITQVAGMAPTEQVGKKRGLFSKILGVAAPFLSFIPGVGPILSTIAGAASQAIGGNWSGAITQAAGGFATGGAFRRTGGGGTPTGGIVHDTARETSLAGMSTLIPRRALGGPVLSGRNYLVGETGPETFTAPASGMITPASPVPVQVVNWPGSGGGGGSSTAFNFLTGGLLGAKLGKGYAAGGLLGAALSKMRARGGPVYRGERYIVGEGGWETFTPAVDGYITPHGQSAPGYGGSGGAAGLLAAAAELRAAVQHLTSMPAHQVVMRGAHGFVRAMDHDAGLIRLVSQRQRLA